MRILVALLSVGFAGTERHAVELANELSRQGHDVAMLLRRRPSEPHRQAAYHMLRNAISPQVSVFLASRALPVFGLWRCLLRFRPDIVHAHAERSVRIASRHAGPAPLIGTLHAPFHGRSFMQCDGLICLTATEAGRISPQYSRPLFVIGNWVRPHARPSDATLAARREEFGLSGNDYVVGTVARIEPEKGLGNLITAFHAANLDASRLLVVGDGSERSQLMRRVDELGLTGRVVFAGFRHDARDLYYLFNAFVLNSADEPFGLAILEAAAAGVPVIATATTGPMAIAQSLPLQLVPPGRPEMLARALSTLRERPAVAYDLSHFAIEPKVREIVDVYRHLLSAKRPAKDLPHDRHLTTSITS